MAVFLGSIEVRIIERGICIVDELWYGVIENQAHCSYFSLYLSIFLYLKKCVTVFSGTNKLESSTLVNIC